MGRVQVLPTGEFTARDGRPGPEIKSWKLDDAQGQALATALNAIAAQTPIVIDYEHQTLVAMTKGIKAPAAGWMKHFEWLAGQGMYADVDWTDDAKAEIKDKKYLYFSPVISYDKTGNVTGLSMGALTNFPGLLGMAPATAALSALASTLDTEEQESTVTLLAALIAGLSLATDSTEQQVIAAVAALKAQVSTPSVPTALAASLKLADGADMTAACSAVAALVATEASSTATIAALQGEIATLRNKGVGDEVVTLVDQALQDGKLLPAQKDWALGMGRKDVAALKGFISTAPVLAPGARQSNGQQQEQDKTAALTAEQTKVFAAFGISAEDAKKHIKGA